VRFKDQTGNVILEFLIYILISIIFFYGFIDIYKIYIFKSESQKISNFLSSSIAKNPVTSTEWLNSQSFNSLEKMYELEDIDISFKCDNLNCSKSSKYIEVEIKKDVYFAFIKFSILSKNRSYMSKFISL